MIKGEMIKGLFNLFLGNIWLLRPASYFFGGRQGMGTLTPAIFEISLIFPSFGKLSRSEARSATCIKSL